MKEKLIAHVRKNDDGSWVIPQDLMEHLINTAKLAEGNAAKFHSADWGKAAGLAHDAGKGRTVWQKYLGLKSGYYDEEAHLEGKPGKMPHAVHGARLVEELYGKAIGRILAYCIAGHHVGLQDWSSAEGAGQSSLEFQQTQIKDISDIDVEIIKAIKTAMPTRPPWTFENGLDLSLWIRMLYSSLVDADFLDTEAYMDIDKANGRGGYCSIPDLLERFNHFMEQMDENAEDTPVNEIRRNIRSKCIQIAHEKPGIFSLTVPTGGGKTLSSLAFALNHAKEHNLERVIYVVPYTSIIEQNADVFRSAVGEDQIVEHHSSLDEDDSTKKTRLAAENWDAPIIVTTSVQFFESLFAAKSSRCRKLHNLAKSVIILDEAQLVPIEYLEPILDTIRLLSKKYGVTFIVSTATQPAFGERTIDDKLFKGLGEIREIMGSEQDVDILYDSLRRCDIQFPQDLNTQSSWEDIAEELQQYEQVLCVVSDRISCRKLHQLMPKGTYHLSALMCGQHRSEKIKEIKQKLKNEEPVRVISTQLVEAGVDLDFPVVYRALAGLDSITQAAGRCNREGKLPGLGKVVVFNAPKKAPEGILRKASDTTRKIIESGENPKSHKIFNKYFSELYWKAISLDDKKIIPLLSEGALAFSFYFRKAAQRFHIIDDSKQKTILVRYGAGDKLINQLKAIGPERWIMRKLQRYTVNIYNENFYELMKRGSIEPVSPEIYAMTSTVEYSKDIGLLVNESIFDPESFIQ